jgi:hypothetical protein
MKITASNNGAWTDFVYGTDGHCFKIDLHICEDQKEQQIFSSLDRCTEHFHESVKENQPILKGVASNLLCSLNPRYVSASKCHLQGVFCYFFKLLQF